MRSWLLVIAVGCASKDAPKNPAEETRRAVAIPPEAATNAPIALDAESVALDPDVPRAIALFRAGVQAQCEAAAPVRYKWLRSDSKWALDIRKDVPDWDQKTEADFVAQCLRRKGR